MARVLCAAAAELDGLLHTDVPWNGRPRTARANPAVDCQRVLSPDTCLVPAARGREDDFAHWLLATLARSDVLATEL